MARSRCGMAVGDRRHIQGAVWCPAQPPNLAPAQAARRRGVQRAFRGLRRTVHRGGGGRSYFLRVARLCPHRHSHRTVGALGKAECLPSEGTSSLKVRRLPARPHRLRSPFLAVPGRSAPSCVHLHSKLSGERSLPPVYTAFFGWAQRGRAPVPSAKAAVSVSGACLVSSQSSAAWR